MAQLIPLDQKIITDSWNYVQRFCILASDVGYHGNNEVLFGNIVKTFDFSTVFTTRHYPVLFGERVLWVPTVILANLLPNLYEAYSIRGFEEAI